MEKHQFTGAKEYLEKSFLEELSYKIWSTKGARFTADKRLRKKAIISNITLAIISAYLIITSLISVFEIDEGKNDNIINYVITALSIMILVINQFENSQDYKLNAKNFHDCGLELSEIYNELRIFKTLKSNPTEFETYTFIKNLSLKYQNILKNYKNHSPIDYKIFQISNLNYFKNISKYTVTKTKLMFYWEVYGWYTIMILSIPILIILIKIE